MRGKPNLLGYPVQDSSISSQSSLGKSLKPQANTRNHQRGISNPFSNVMYSTKDFNSFDKLEIADEHDYIPMQFTNRQLQGTVLQGEQFEVKPSYLQSKDEKSSQSIVILDSSPLHELTQESVKSSLIESIQSPLSQRMIISRRSSIEYVNDVVRLTSPKQNNPELQNASLISFSSPFMNTHLKKDIQTLKKRKTPNKSRQESMQQIGSISYKSSIKSIGDKATPNKTRIKKSQLVSESTPKASNSMVKSVSVYSTTKPYKMAKRLEEKVKPRKISYNRDLVETSRNVQSTEQTKEVINKKKKSIQTSINTYSKKSSIIAKKELEKPISKEQALHNLKKEFRNQQKILLSQRFESDNLYNPLSGKIFDRLSRDSKRRQFVFKRVMSEVRLQTLAVTPDKSLFASLSRKSINTSELQRKRKQVNSIDATAPVRTQIEFTKRAKSQLKKKNMSVSVGTSPIKKQMKVFTEKQSIGKSSSASRLSQQQKEKDVTSVSQKRSLTRAASVEKQVNLVNRMEADAYARNKRQQYMQRFGGMTNFQIKQVEQKDNEIFFQTLQAKLSRDKEKRGKSMNSTQLELMQRQTPDFYCGIDKMMKGDQRDSVGDLNLRQEDSDDDY